MQLKKRDLAVCLLCCRALGVDKAAVEIFQQKEDLFELKWVK